MKRPDTITSKIYTLNGLLKKLMGIRLSGKKVVFTNGVFDLLHPGHLKSLCDAAKEADFLIVAINADVSVKRLKGDDRPVYNEIDRAFIIASLVIVDAVIIFDEDTPLELIKAVRPNVLVKGGDYTIEQVVGSREVMENGGRVVINPLLEGYSTSSFINQIKDRL